MAADETPDDWREETRYGVSDDEQEELDLRFTYHPPEGDQPQRYQFLRRNGKRLATLFMDRVPPSRERSIALTKLEEAIMWANAGIARNE